MPDSKNLYWDSNMADNLTEMTERDPSFANPDDVKTHVAYKDAQTREYKIGEMPVHEGRTVILGYHGSYHIPLGYHDGTGVIQVRPLEEVTFATATAEDIAFNKTAWVNGILLVGTLDKNQNEMIATATADDIVESKTAWVNKILLTGTIPRISREDVSLLAGQSYGIPYGLHGGNAIISTASLASQTQATATAEEILQGKTAWVNGVLLEGTMLSILDAATRDTNANANDIRLNKTAYTAFGLTTGAMPEFVGRPTKILNAGEGFTIPLGYHNGTWIVKAESLIAQTSATAGPNDIRKGKNAWVDGVLVEGTMIQTIAPGTPATATPEDILFGKTAWVNEELLSGKCLFDTVQYHEFISTKGSSDTMVVTLLPLHKWESIGYIDIDIFSNDNMLLYHYHVEDIHAGSIIENVDNDENMVMSIITTYNSPRVVFNNFIANSYAHISIYNYCPSEAKATLKTGSEINTVLNKMYNEDLTADQRPATLTFEKSAVPPGGG